VYRLGDGDTEVWIPRILKSSGLVKSTGEAIRLIKQGGVRVNGERFLDPQENLPRGEYILQIGKRRFLRILTT